MAGHLARNQVHAGSIPAALTTVGSPPGRSDALQATPDGFDSRALHSSLGSVLLGEQSVSKADEQRSNRCRPAARTEWPRLPIKECSEVSNLVRVLEGAAEWSATGPENPGRGESPRGSIPPPSSSPRSGSVSEWPGDGLQNRLRRFESDRSLRLLRTVVRAVRTRSSKPERRVRLSHGTQRQEVAALARFPVVQWKNTRLKPGGRRFDFSQGPERCERAPGPRTCPSSIAGDAAVL